jgi:hypothetical protein
VAAFRLVGNYASKTTAGFAVNIRNPDTGALTDAPFSFTVLGDM